MRRRILLADDSVTIQKVIELTFLDEDYEVKAVSNGDEALAVLPQVDPDFVIADVHMPGANGYEVCRRAKEMKPNVPVLLLVGTFEPFDEGQSRSAGADSFLKKPFDSQELLQRVEDLLAARANAAPASSPLGASPFAAPPPGGDFLDTPGLDSSGLDMPPLSDLPPLDLGPAPSTPFASAPTPEPFAAQETDWGSFRLDAPAEPEPFPAPAPFPAPSPFASSPQSSFDESPFTLDEEPPAGASLRSDDGALLPAGEPMFDLDADSSLEDTSLGDLPAGDLRGGELGDAAPVLETPAFESPAFGASADESPAYASPSYEAPAYEPPAYEPPSFEAAPSYAAPFELPEPETQRLETPALQPFGFDTTPEERLGVPQGAAPLVDSLAETESRIEAPPPPSFEQSHEPASTLPAPAPVHAAPVGAPLGVGSAVPAAAVHGGNGGMGGGGALSDADIDRIARRVVELMGDKAVRDVAWEVIPDLAEVVIRDRLRDLESQAESFE